MILGKVCTRSCRFCGVANISGSEILPPDVNEPAEVAKMVNELGLAHVVITSVTRDDLADEGASQFAATINEIRRLRPVKTPSIEVLTPDFNARKELIDVVCKCSPEVFNHNIETVKRLSSTIRSKADYERSLSVLKYVSDNFPNVVVKSGVMVGLGETKEEVIETLRDLCNAGCSIVTIGQYFAPSKANANVEKIYTDDEFDYFKKKGEEAGIKYVFSGRFVRSSYLADEALNFTKKQEL